MKRAITYLQYWVRSLARNLVYKECDMPSIASTGNAAVMRLQVPGLYGSLPQ
jgi:hypothetical protein